VSRPSRRLARRLGIAVLFVLLAGLTLALLAEGGLRLAAWVLLQAREPEGAAGGGPRTLLCLGDSWVYGAESGDPGHSSFPARLQALLDQRVGRGRWRVLNRGRPGQSAARLAGQLPALLDRTRPAGVVLLVGTVVWFSRERPQAHGVGRLTSSGEGFWRSLRLVRALRLLQAEPPFRPPDALLEQQAAIREQLLAVLRGPHAPGDDRGTPPIPFDGCPDREQVLALLARARSAGDPREPGLRDLLRRQPRCLAARITAAELCLARRDLACARANAERAQALREHEPHSLLARTLAVVNQHGHWSKPTWGATQVLRERYPGYLRARRQHLTASVALNHDLCQVHFDLLDLLRRYPDCPWARQALGQTRKILGRPLWQQLRRELRDDLSLVLAHCRRRGVPVLMLNYPPSDIRPCNRVVLEIIAEVARDHEVPLLDLAGVLGPFSSRRRSALYSAGGHPSAAGYARIAGAVLERLAALGWLEPAP
jgi:lysophospholipase L1-like esterase